MLTGCQSSQRLRWTHVFCQYLCENKKFCETIFACFYWVQVEFFFIQKSVENLVMLSLLNISVYKWWWWWLVGIVYSKLNAVYVCNGTKDLQRKTGSVLNVNGRQKKKHR